MPVVALCEKGLVIDVFGDKPVLMKCEHFKRSRNKLVSIYRNNIRFIDLENLKSFKDDFISSFEDVKMSKDGAKVAVLGSDKRLTVYIGAEKTWEMENIDLFDISDKYLSYSKEGTVYVKNIVDRTVEYQKQHGAKTIKCFNTFCIVVTSENTIRVVTTGKQCDVLTLPKFYKMNVISSADESRNVLVLDVDYAKDSYYAETALYYLCFSACAINNEAVKTVFKNDLLSFYHYSQLTRIQDVGFFQDNFYVCYGDQPTQVKIFNGGTGEMVKKYNRGMRNKVAFSRDGTRVIMAGLGNLPGIIKVYENEKITAQIECLGASDVMWMNDDSHLVVFTTEYFKGENKVEMYDYYGRGLEVMDCDKLYKAEVYGADENKMELEPVDSLPEEENTAIYVPPKRSPGELGGMPKPKVAVDGAAQKKGKKAKPKVVDKVVRTRETVEEDLSKARELKERLGKGEELTLEEENLVFGIKGLEDELSKLK